MTLANGEAWIIHPGETTDGYGQAAPDWNDPQVIEAGPVWYHQTGSVDDTDQRDAEITTATLTIWNPAVAVGAGDRVAYVGAAGFVIADVVGKPHVATTPRGPHHLELQLRTVEG